jgi:hypothetical protein
MATSRSTGFTVTAAIWNAVLAGLTDAGVYIGQIVSTFSGGHTLTAGSNGDQSVQLTNTTSGTAARAYLGAAAGTTNGFLITNSQGYTPSGPNLAASVLLYGDGVGGLGLVANLGALRFYSGGTTQRALYDANGHYVLGSGTAITDGVGTPTLVGSDFGTGATIVGKSYGFVITCGAGPNSTGAVNFGTTYATAPCVVVSTNGKAAGGSETVYVDNVTTTQATFYSYNAGSLAVMVAGQQLHVHVRGF